MTKAADAPITGARADTLLECHPAPWAYGQELEGQPPPFRYQEEPDVLTDDARRRHVVRDARGSVVIECIKSSKNEEEGLARVIAAIPRSEAEIEALNSRVAKLTAECSRLHSINAKLCAVLPAVIEAAVEDGGAKLEAELATRANAARQRSGVGYGFACTGLRYAIRDAIDGARIPVSEDLVEAVLWKLHEPSVRFALRALLDHADEACAALAKENGHAA